MAQRAPGQRRQPLRQLDRRRVGEAGQNDVLQPVQLILEGSVDARVGVAEQVHPPRADGVQIAPAVEIVQPRARTARDRDQGQRRRFRGISSGCKGCQTAARLRSSQSRLDP
jgi:hypothetical protein